MKVCIFGAASAHIRKEYIASTEELGEKLAKRGHTLVFGAGGTGLMGAAARGFKKGGGYVYGVVPKFIKDEELELLYDAADEVTYTDDMAQRKKKMEDEADVFVIAPGGIGTMEEFFEVITLKLLRRHAKKVVIFNIDGYYDGLEAFMSKMRSEKFLYGDSELYFFADSADGAVHLIES